MEYTDGEGLDMNSSELETGKALDEINSKTNSASSTNISASTNTGTNSIGGIGIGLGLDQMSDAVGGKAFGSSEPSPVSNSSVNTTTSISARSQKFFSHAYISPSTKMAFLNNETTGVSSSSGGNTASNNTNMIATESGNSIWSCLDGITLPSLNMHSTTSATSNINMNLPSNEVQAPLPPSLDSHIPVPFPFAASSFPFTATSTNTANLTSYMARNSASPDTIPLPVVVSQSQSQLHSHSHSHSYNTQTQPQYPNPPTQHSSPLLLPAITPHMLSNTNTNPSSNTSSFPYFTSTSTSNSQSAQIPISIPMPIHSLRVHRSPMPGLSTLGLGLGMDSNSNLGWNTNATGITSALPGSSWSSSGNTDKKETFGSSISNSTSISSSGLGNTGDIVAATNSLMNRNTNMSVNTTINASNANSAALVPAANLFDVIHQPNEKQRKSYKKENRCLLPNPITIALKDKYTNMTGQHKIEGGRVTVRLVYENKEELDSSKQNILDGDLEKDLDSECKSQFSLKVLETSESRKFRLLFTVKYWTSGGFHEETVLSHPFSVTSNKKKVNIENPKVFDIKPRGGLATEETEVWIKGKQFTERSCMCVKFGGKPAKITETEENLITCVAPPLGDIAEDISVIVEVSNFHPAHGQLFADVTIPFTYAATASSGSNRKRLKQFNPTHSLASISASLLASETHTSQQDINVKTPLSMSPSASTLMSTSAPASNFVHRTSRHKYVASEPASNSSRSAQSQSLEASVETETPATSKASSPITTTTATTSGIGVSNVPASFSSMGAPTDNEFLILDLMYDINKESSQPALESILH